MQSKIGIQTVTIGLRVRSLKESTAWYEKLLGERPTIEPVPGIREYELTKGCWLQLIESSSVTPGDSTVRIGIPDVQVMRNRLSGVGIDTGEIIRIEGVIARCEFKDPDGNKISLYQLL